MSELVSPEADPLLTIALVIVAGQVGGALAKRLSLPSITGQVVAGVLVGQSGAALVSEHALHGLKPLTDFALGLIAVTVGSHLNLKRLRNAGRRLGVLLLAEITITPSLVFLGLWLVGGRPPAESILYATVSIATAPATVVALVRELHARGVFVKTLVAAVALNNLACIFLFEVARAFSVSSISGVAHLEQPIINVLVAVTIGASLAIAVRLLAYRLVKGRGPLTTMAVMTLLLAVGLAMRVGVSPLLSCLALGVVQANLTPERSDLVDAFFEDFIPVILTIFFTLAGMHLKLESFGLVTAIAGLFFILRALGKVLSGWLAMRVVRATLSVQRNLGLALIPQAGVAVGLVLLIQDEPAFASFQSMFTASVLTAVTSNEIVGPLLTRMALRRSGEAGMDGKRLLDFLQEENIVTEFSAESKPEAIRKLVDLLVSSHHLRLDREALARSVLQRENEVSTCLGGGLAIPHGELTEINQMYGVMAISRLGLNFEAPDGRAIHCMVLLATPPGQRQRHLEVLATLARTVGMDTEVQARLFEARTPAHAYDILHEEAAVHFNYFLDEPT
ncbi:MAG: cation:proton antiporter [Myxococcales bacterium]|nr:cation:proton antiporter [Myxococcales bacterium]